MVDHGSVTSAFVCFLNFPFFRLPCSIFSVKMSRFRHS